MAKAESGSKEIKSAKPFSLPETSLSDESSLESESEWETSLKLKKGFEERRDRSVRKTDSNVEEIMDKNGKEILHKSEGEILSKNEEELEDSKGNIETKENVRIECKSDSEFISDESFSANTEGQLEELEEMRLKQVDEDQNFSKDFDDSDFSFSENSEKFDIIGDDFAKLNSNDEFEIREEKEEDNSKCVLSRRNSGKEESLKEEMKGVNELEKVEDIDIEKSADGFVKEHVKNRMSGRTPLSSSQMDRDGELDGEVTDSKIENMQKKEVDGAELLQSVVNDMENRGGANGRERIVPEHVDLYQKRKKSDDDNRKSSEVVLTHIEPSTIQTLESENYVTPVSMESIESEVNVKKKPALNQKQPRVHIENGAEHGDVSEHKVFDELEEIEEEFERKLKEKEIESGKPLQFDKDGIRNPFREEVLSDEMDIQKEIKVRKV